MKKGEIRCNCNWVEHDITFCTSGKCSATYFCDRHVSRHTFKEGELVSMSDFFSPKHKCKNYIKGGDK